MAKTFHNDVLDGALNVVKNNGTELNFCSQEPATFAEVATYELVKKTSMTSGSYTGPADNGGAGGGRKLTVNAVNAMTPDGNGTVTYAVITDGSAKILAGTTVTSQVVATTQSWNSPAFDLIVKDPT